MYNTKTPQIVRDIRIRITSYTNLKLLGNSAIAYKGHSCRSKLIVRNWVLGITGFFILSKYSKNYKYMYTIPEFQNFRNENKKENMPCMQEKI